MILIIGGAYQGKLDYAKTQLNVTDADVFHCDGPEIDFEKRCIHGIEQFVLNCVNTGQDPIAYFKAHRAEWSDSILICQDISCGVVPMGRDMRQWRDGNGRLCQYLAAEAERVFRIFCGLEQRLK